MEQCVAWGNIGIKNLKNTWVPNFGGILAKMTDLVVGAST